MLYGGGSGTAYDAAFRRWVPAPPTQVLPDGSAYVYELQLADGSFEIHLVRMATASDRVIAHFVYDNAYSLIAFQPEGVFVEPIIHRRWQRVAPLAPEPYPNYTIEGSCA